MNIGGAGQIVARGLTRRFGSKLALEPFDIEIAPGTVTGLLGPNGSGKSTLMRMLIGLVRPDAGHATVDGVELRGDGTAIRKRCTYAPGEMALYGELSGERHLEWFLRGREREARERARKFASDFGLPLGKRVHTYSHGMKRQLMFSAALAPRVRVRVLDEPSDGLDPNKRSTLIELLEADAALGTTILLSSHHLGEVDRVCDTFVFLNQGRKLSVESAVAIAERSRRTLRVTFTHDAHERLQRTQPFEHATITLRTGELTARLHDDDPRAFLAELAARSDLPSPLTVEYGRASLQSLYRDLYGVEAC